MTGWVVIIVTSIGVVINTLTALLFMRGQHDLNIKGAFLHMAADALVSAGVVIAGILMLTVGWLWIDPVISIVVTLVILLGTWSLLKDSLNYSLDAVPNSIHIEDIKAQLLALPGSVALHDLHVWSMSTTEVAMTVHLTSEHAVINNQQIGDIQSAMHDDFGIDHTTVPMETSQQASHCRLK